MFFSWPLVVKSISLGLTSLANWSSRQLLKHLPRLWILGIFTILACLIIRYNTIIHPFTLADNRHYIFYVFRLLRRHWLVKYLAAPVYIVSGWLVVYCFGRNELSSDQQVGRKPANDVRKYRIGFVLVWIVTSALSLITAPLVEPRYFIIPWVVWRLQVASPFSDLKTWAGKVVNKPRSQILAPSAPPHAWLLLETLWYCIINAVTGYIFLHWTFEWPQEPGAKQRFMW
jgi:alpha-1,2-glucosyltransferase